MKIKEEKKTKSYLAILEASKHLFWKYGITRVTVEEICEQANVSKMSFYRNFENKLDVAEIVLKQLADKGLSDYNDIMKLDIQFNEKIHRIVQMKYNNSENLSEDFIKDIYGAENSKLKNILSEARVKSSESLHKDFSNAQQSGEIRQDLKIDFVIYMINSLNEKMVDDRLTSMYGNTQELAVELTNFIFYGIMPRNN